MSLILPFNVLIKESLAQNFTSDIDASFLSAEDNRLYLLRGDQYVRLTFYVGQGATMDSGYPQPISNWADPPDS
jgi:Hemopexin